MTFPHTFPIKNWRRRADSNRRVTVLQTVPFATWVRRQVRVNGLPEPSTFGLNRSLYRKNRDFPHV